MDKNTIWGILLMGAVIFGFMWLNQPSAEQRAQMEKERQEQLMAEQEKSASTTVLTVDSVNAAEIAGIRRRRSHPLARRHTRRNRKVCREKCARGRYNQRRLQGTHPR